MTFAEAPQSSPYQYGIGGKDGSLTKAQARRQFDAWAHSYDRSVVQHLLFQPTYRLFLEELYRWRGRGSAPFDLLDVGCGTGTWLAMVARCDMAWRRLVGLDYSAAMCSLARGKAEQVGAGWPLFLNADSEHLPLADASFDVITCSHSFHHYPHQQAVVREMRRLLRPGGRLMIIDGFRDNVIGWVLFDVFVTRAESTPQAPVQHVAWSTMRHYFEEAGFSKIRQVKRNIWAPLLLTVGEVAER